MLGDIDSTLILGPHLAAAVFFDIPSTFLILPHCFSHPVDMASGPSLDFLSTRFSLSRVDDARLTPLQEGTSSAIALPLVDQVRT